MLEGKNSFVLYHDIREPLELLTDDERGKLFLALLNYSEFGAIPDFTGALRMAFAFIQASLDRDAVAWERKREKRREAGSLGGKQRAANQANASSACLAEANQANASGVCLAEANQANQAVPVPVPVPAPVPVPVPVIERGADKPPRAARFSPPSVQEVTEYCRERGNGINPQKFVDFYASKGWRVGSQAMKDWRAAVRTWEQREGSGTDDRDSRAAGGTGRKGPRREFKIHYDNELD